MTTDYRPCPSCGARNVSDALWCSQCYHRFEGASTESSEHGLDAARGSPPAAYFDLEPEPLLISDDGEPEPVKEKPEAVWRCKRCQATNPLVESVCSQCGLSIYEAMGATKVTIEPDAAFKAGLLFPGRGEAKLGATALAVSVGATALFGVVFGFILMLAGAVGWGVGIVLIGAASWLTGALDARARAMGNGFLRPGMLTAAFGTEFGFMIGAALQASNRP